MAKDKKPEKLEEYFVLREEIRLEGIVKEMRESGRTEYQICRYLERVANIYLNELKNRRCPAKE